MHTRTILLSLLALCVPLAALAYSRPVRIVQAVSGVECSEDSFCTDDRSRLDEAKRLYGEAHSFVSRSITPLDSKPLVVFCSTESCYQAFGSSDATARSIGGFCIVISPRGWKPYYVRHELIHRLQWQELGAIKMFSEPDWFIEGMAYSLSEDPRTQLMEPFQGFRSRFSAWYGTVARGQLWTRAAQL